MTVFKNVLPVDGKKVRNDAFPNKPISATEPTKVKWSGYWQRRLAAKEIKVVGADATATDDSESVSTTETDTVTDASEADAVTGSDDSVSSTGESETKKKRIKKSKSGE